MRIRRTAASAHYCRRRRRLQCNRDNRIDAAATAPPDNYSCVPLHRSATISHKPRPPILIQIAAGFSPRLTRYKRHTPVSVRFLGRRVYRAATVVLASALRAGLSDWRVKQLTEWIGVPRRTLERWHAWWVHEFVDTRFWVIAHGQFMPPVEVAALPASLLARFDSSDLASQLTATLRFLAPLGEGR